MMDKVVALPALVRTWVSMVDTELWDFETQIIYRYGILVLSRKLGGVEDLSQVPYRHRGTGGDICPILHPRAAFPERKA
jgi:hypothetical protein